MRTWRRVRKLEVIREVKKELDFGGCGLCDLSRQLAVREDVVGKIFFSLGAETEESSLLLGGYRSFMKGVIYDEDDDISCM